MSDWLTLGETLAVAADIRDSLKYVGNRARVAIEAWAAILEHHPAADVIADRVCECIANCRRIQEIAATQTADLVAAPAHLPTLRAALSTTQLLREALLRILIACPISLANI